METITELLQRKIEWAREEVKLAEIQKERDIAKADERIAVAKKKLDIFEDLVDLDWKGYAKRELESQ